MNHGRLPLSGASPLSVLVLTHDEAMNLPRCLESVKDWVGELIVVDSGSTDSTVDIAREFGARVFRHRYVSHAEQLDWALSSVPFTYSWVLLLDADDAVSPELHSQIRKVLRHDRSGIVGYFCGHRYWFRGRAMRGHKQWVLRLFQRGRARIDRSELVDFRVVVDGLTGQLSGRVDESNRKEDNIDFWTDKQQRFASRLASEEVLRRYSKLTWSFHPTLFGNPDQRMAWLKLRWYRAPLYVRPFLYFLYRYVIRLGFLDGRPGLVFHILHALWFRLLVDIKIHDLMNRLQRGELTLDNLVLEPDRQGDMSGEIAGRTK